MNRITIATIQPPVFAEKSSEHHTRIIEAGLGYLKEALQAGAELCCLPEYFNVFGVTEQEMQALASNADDLLEIMDSGGLAPGTFYKRIALA